MAEKFSIAKENTLRGKLFYFFLWIFVAPVIRLIFIKKASGLENLPKDGPYILAANHQSYLDFLCLQAVLPDRLTFLAAEKFYASRLFGPILRCLGHIKVDRNAKDKSDTIEEVISALNQGKAIAIFPQGGRSRTGKIEKFYSGVARFALAADAQIVLAGIKGTYEIFPPQKKFPKFKKVVEIKINASPDLSKYKGRPGEPEIYRQMTDELMKEIAKLSGLEYGEGIKLF